HPGAGLAPGGAPALLQALAGGREVEGERPLVQRVTEVLDGDRGGEPAARPVAPVVGGVLDVAGDRGLCRRGLPGDQTEGRDACRGRGHGPSPQAAWDLHESSTPGGTEAYLGALPIVRPTRLGVQPTTLREPRSAGARSPNVPEPRGNFHATPPGEREYGRHPEDPSLTFDPQRVAQSPGERSHPLLPWSSRDPETPFHARTPGQEVSRARGPGPR